MLKMHFHPEKQQRYLAGERHSIIILSLLYLIKAQLSILAEHNIQECYIFNLIFFLAFDISCFLSCFSQLKHLMIQINSRSVGEECKTVVSQ